MDSVGGITMGGLTSITSEMLGIKSRNQLLQEIHQKADELFELALQYDTDAELIFRSNNNGYSIGITFNDHA